MRTLRALWMRLAGMFRRDRGEADFAEELDAHIAMHTEAGVDAGLNTAEARRQALARMGGREQVRQAYRDRRVLLWLENFLQDMNAASRTGVHHNCGCYGWTRHWRVHRNLQPGERGVDSIAPIWRPRAAGVSVHAKSQSEDSG